jgi:predicted HicB family RNase H-like nuclease
MPKPKTKKAGRPPFAKGDAKEKFIRVRVTPDEDEAIKEKAKVYKKSVSEWIRSTLNAAK